MRLADKIATMARRGAPQAYDFIERVHFSGASTCYIDTGFKANTTTTRFVGAFSFDDISLSAGIIGSRNGSSSSSTSCNVFIIDNGTIRLDWTSGNATLSVPVVSNEKIDVEFGRPKSTIQSVDYISSNSTSHNQTFNFFIGNFANASANPYSNGFKGCCYECFLYSSDELVRHYLPCIRRSDSKVGFLETLPNEFVTNDGFSVAYNSVSGASSTRGGGY